MVVSTTLSFIKRISRFGNHKAGLEIYRDTNKALSPPRIFGHLLTGEGIHGYGVRESELQDLQHQNFKWEKN